MKPSLPEIGTILKLQGDSAIVIMKSGEACKGCGQAKIGLCKSSGYTLFVTAKNYIGAKVGDRVTVGLNRGIRIRGYLLAFIIPLVSLISGALIGDVVGRHFSISSLDVVVSFSFLIVTSFFSFKKLKHLDLSSSLTITSIKGDYTYFSMNNENCLKEGQDKI